MLLLFQDPFFQNRRLSYSVAAMAGKGDHRPVSKALRAFALGFPEKALWGQA